MLEKIIDVNKRLGIHWVKVCLNLPEGLLSSSFIIRPHQLVNIKNTLGEVNISYFDDFSKIFQKKTKPEVK